MLSENLSPNTLRPIFSNALSLRLETIKLDAFIRNFSAGQTLPGKVVQVLPEQKAVVEFQGEKLLLQFPRPVSPGQTITVKVEQVHPNPVLRLTEFSPAPPSAKTESGGSPKETGTSITPGSDKTSIQNRLPDPPQSAQATQKNSESAPRNPATIPSASGEKDGSPLLNQKAVDPLTKPELNRLGIEIGQKAKAEVVRVVNRETVQVRFGSHDIIVKNTASRKMQPGEPVILQAKSVVSGKYLLEIEPKPVPSAATRPSVGLSVLKNYLPARQPFVQVLSVLKEIFLDSPSSQLKPLNIDPAQLEQLKTNLQKIVSREFKNLDAPQLKELVDRSGFHYEAKVKDFAAEPVLSNKNALLENDLKGQLMRLARQLEQAPVAKAENAASDKGMGKLIAQVNQAVSNIELQQLTHHFSRQEHHPLLLQLPENLLGEEDRFKIYILPNPDGSHRQQSDLQNRVFNLVFLLNLSALGDLRIETRVFKNEISILITGSNFDVVQFIQEHAPELEAPLREEGFSLSVTSRHETEVSMEIAGGLDQLLIDIPLQLVDIKT